MFHRHVRVSTRRVVALALFASGPFYVNGERHSKSYSQAREFASSNPLLCHQTLPKFSKICPADVEPAVNACLAAAQSDFTVMESSFESGTAPNYASTIEALEILQFPLSYTWGVVNHLLGVKNSDELRKAHEAVQPHVIAFSQRVGQSRRLFKALHSLKKNEEEWAALDSAQQRIIDAYILKMENSGVGLSEGDRKIFNKLQIEVSELSTKFSNNILESTSKFKLKVTHRADVEGLPLSARALAADRAKAQGCPEVSQPGRVRGLYCMSDMERLNVRGRGR